MKKSVVEIVNEKIIEKLENGVNPWRKTWVTSGGVRTNTPMNYISNKPYNGINYALLEPGYYMTFNQCKNLGGNIKKGAKGHLVIFSAPIENKEEEEDKKARFVLRYYYVFSIEDCENFKAIKTREKPKEQAYFETKKIGEIENLINDYITREKLKKLQNLEQSRAYYKPSTDEIVLPLVKQFENVEEYYSALFHELAHSTGHRSRLNREGIETVNYFGSEKYSKEELIAEITSTYCLNFCNLETDSTISNSTAYLKSWAEKLKGNTANYFIMNATTHAEKAYKLIMNLGD